MQGRNPIAVRQAAAPVARVAPEAGHTVHASVNGHAQATVTTAELPAARGPRTKPLGHT